MDERLETIQKFEQYLKRRAPGRRTSIDYVSDVRQFAATCLKSWVEVTMHDIDTFVDQQRQAGLSAATIKRRVAALKVFFDFLAEDSGQLAWPNPVRFKRHAGKQPKRLPRDLSNEQVERLWAVITSPRDRAWFALMLRAGLRVGEVVALTLADVLTPPGFDQPARLRVYGKGQKERIVLLTADAYGVVQEWLQVRPGSLQGALFLNERGQPLSANGIEWLLRHYGQSVDLGVTPHQLRHTFARQLLEGGMPLTSLGKLLGHAQLSTTEIYTGGADPSLVEAYQTAMTHLARAALPAASEKSADQPLPSLPEVLSTTADFLRPPPPDWQAWAPDLPAGLRQASLAFVQRRLPTWQPQRQRHHALHLLGNLRRFWTWQLSQRVITHPAELTLADLQAYQTAHLAAGQAASSINRVCDDLLALLRQLADQGQTIDPALARLRYLPRPQPLPRHLSETQAQGLEAYVRQRLDSPDPLIRLENACFFILAHTGLRASECVDLLRQDLDLAGRRLIVRQGKGQRDRVVYLSPLAQQALTLYLTGLNLTPTSPLLLQPTGHPISYMWLYSHIVALGQAAGQIAVTPHQLRHTLATRLLNARMPITGIQKILGHDHLNTTMIYARVLDVTLEADYQQAMRQIEAQQLPMARTSELVPDWPMPQTAGPLTRVELAQTNFDNFV